METAAKASKISRIDFRYRHSAQDVTPSREPTQEPEEELETTDDVEEPLLIREQKGRAVMGRAHRMFHRRVAAEPPNVLTIVVGVVATVDTSGNTIGLATSTPGLANAAAVSTAVVLPSVPAVPPFPSDLTVPAYPWPSGVPTAPVTSSTAVPSLSSSILSSSGVSSAVSSASALPSSLGFNSTTSSTILSSSFTSTLNSTSFTSTSSRTSSLQSFSSTRSSSQIPTTTTSDAATSTSPLGGGGGDPVNTGPGSAETTSVTGAGGVTNAVTTLDTPKVVGSVIGSLAGAALFLAIILLLIRRHKRKLAGGVSRQITADDAADSQPMASSGQQMDVASRRSYVPASTAAFFNRFSGASRSTAETSTTAGGGERGFQRISGRKLPSAFSEGMTSEQFAREGTVGTLSGASFYTDDKGFYGGPGLAAAKETGEPSSVGGGERIVTMPSPARTPTIHHPPPPFGASRNGGSMLSPPHSPNPSIPSRGTLGRSHPSQDGSRHSKFSEDV